MEKVIPELSKDLSVKQRGELRQTILGQHRKDDRLKKIKTLQGRFNLDLGQVKSEKGASGS